MYNGGILNLHYSFVDVDIIIVTNTHGDMRNAYKILAGNIERKRQFNGEKQRKEDTNEVRPGIFTFLSH